MALAQKSTLLERLQEKINIDVDSLDTSFIQSLPIIPNDQTCNPAWLFLRLQHPSIQRFVEEVLGADANVPRETDTFQFLTRIAIRFCKDNLPFIKGRVLVQTTPSGAYSTQATLDHARLYVQEFERAGIAKDRYCIKIMATGPGLVAAKTLQQEGIAILGTGVFSVEQAVACFQAGCLYVSPYYNGMRELQEPSFHEKYDDVALQHPFSSRLVQMVQAFKELYSRTGQTPPFIKNAGFASVEEIIASAEIGCHSVTVSSTVLEEMLDPKYDGLTLPDRLPIKLDNQRYVYAEDLPIPSPRLRGLLNASGTTAATINHHEHPLVYDRDYLANRGEVLDTIVLSDALARERVKDALNLFIAAEKGSLKLIQGFLCKL